MLAPLEFPPWPADHWKKQHSPVPAGRMGDWACPQLSSTRHNSRSHWEFFQPERPSPGMSLWEPQFWERRLGLLIASSSGEAKLGLLAFGGALFSRVPVLEHARPQGCQESVLQCAKGSHQNRGLRALRLPQGPKSFPSTYPSLPLACLS